MPASNDPLAGLVTIPFRFDRASKPDELGPLGDRYVAFPNEANKRSERIPNLGIMRRMGARFTTLGFSTLGSGLPRWNSVDLSRPSLLVPVDPIPSPPALVSTCVVSWWPESPGGELLGGIPTIDGIIHAPAPGRIYVSGSTGQATAWQIPYAILPAEDTGLVKLMLEGLYNQGWGSATQRTLAAGVAAVVQTLDTMFLSNGLILSNTGANPARFAIGLDTAALGATDGVLLAAGETRYLERPYFQNTGQLVMRSAAGTTVVTSVMRRSMGLV